MIIQFMLYFGGVVVRLWILPVLAWFFRPFSSSSSLLFYSLFTFLGSIGFSFLSSFSSLLSSPFLHLGAQIGFVYLAQMGGGPLRSLLCCGTFILFFLYKKLYMHGFLINIYIQKKYKLKKFMYIYNLINQQLCLIKNFINNKY